MAITPDEDIEIAITIETVANIVFDLNGGFSGNIGAGVTLVKISPKNSYKGYNEFINSIQKMIDISIAKNGERVFSFWHQGSNGTYIPFGYQGNWAPVKIYPLSSVGNGLATAKGIFSPPPPPFSTKFLYCNTITSSLPGTTLGISLIENEALVKIYPNPNYGDFYMQSDLPNATVTIYNAMGVIIYKFPLEDKIPIKLASKGLFIAEVANGDKRARMKIIVQ